MPKATTPTTSHKRRHNPLEDDLLATGLLKNREGRPSKREATKKQAEEQPYVDAKASRKILAMSRDLMEEEELQSGAKGKDGSALSAFDFDLARLEAGSDEEEEFANEEEWGDEDDVVEQPEVDAADLETFNRFVAPTMNDDPLLTHGWDGKPGDGAEEQKQGTNLADLILAKIAEKEAMQGGGRQEDGNPVEEDYELPPKVVEVYSKYVASALRRRGGVHSDGGADVRLESGSSLPGTSRAPCRSPSRSFPRSRTGRTYCRLRGQIYGTYASHSWPRLRRVKRRWNWWNAADFGPLKDSECVLCCDEDLCVCQTVGRPAVYRDGYLGARPRGYLREQEA